MKRRMSTLMLTVIASTFVLLMSCEQRNDSMRNRQQGASVDTGTMSAPTASAAAEEKKEYEGAIEARLDDFDNRLSQLESSTSRMGDMKAGKQTSEKVVNDLKMKLEAAKTKLSEIKSADPDNWQNMKADMDKTVASVESDFSKHGLPTSGTGMDRNRMGQDTSLIQNH